MVKNSGFSDAKKSRILIAVDDARLNLEIVQLAEKNKHQIVGTADRVAHALQLAGCDKLSLAILDTHLNGQSTLEIARALDKNNTPYVFCSADSHIEFPDDIRPLMILRKPFDSLSMRLLMTLLSEFKDNMKADNDNQTQKAARHSDT